MPDPTNPMPAPTMHLLEFDPEAKTIVEIRKEQWNRDPGCHYIKTESKGVEIPVLASGGLDYLVWQHPDWKPPVVAEAALTKPVLSAAMTTRPNYIKCIAHTHGKLIGKSWCGILGRSVFFKDLDHAAYSIKAETYMVPCPECLEEARRQLTNA